MDVDGKLPLGSVPSDRFSEGSTSLWRGSVVQRYRRYQFLVFVRDESGVSATARKFRIFWPINGGEDSQPQDDVASFAEREFLMSRKAGSID